MSHFLLDEAAFQVVIDSYKLEIQTKERSKLRMVLMIVTSLSGVIDESLAFGQ
jgi:hypothetical protein